MKTYSVSVISAAFLSLGAITASGALIQDTPAFSELSGTGLGSVSTVLTMASPASASVSSGCSFWDGATSDTGAAGCPVGGFGGDELALNSTFTLAGLGLTDFSDLRVLYNSSEPASNSVQLDDLRLLIQDSTGFLLHAEVLLSPVLFATTESGTGTSAFRFRIDDPTTANLFLNPTNRLGLAAAASLETGGNETFFLAVEGGDDGVVIPEPSTLSLSAIGGLLLGFAWVARRRRAS